MQRMTSTYRSKIDTWLIAVLVPAMLAAGYVAFSSLTSNPMVPWWYSLLIAAIGVVLPGWVLLATYYRFEGRELVIRSGPFIWRVSLADIKEVKPTENALSSPALSLDRLRIDYGAGRWLMISPREKEEFLRELEMRRRAL